jgi:hypothetical protein
MKRTHRLFSMLAVCLLAAGWCSWGCSEETPSDVPPAKEPGSIPPPSNLPDAMKGKPSPP